MHPRFQVKFQLILKQTPHGEITLDCSRTNTTCLAMGCVLSPGDPVAPDGSDVMGGMWQVGTLCL